MAARRASLDAGDLNSMLQNFNISTQERSTRLPTSNDWAPGSSSFPRAKRSSVARTGKPSVARTGKRSVPRTMQSPWDHASDLQARYSSMSVDSSSYTQSNESSSLFDTATSTYSENTDFCALDEVDELDDFEEEVQPIYECEFSNCTVPPCDWWYFENHEEAWINHIAIDHMQNKFPKESWCWYCDEVFKAESKEDRQDAFYRRMIHISDHIRNEPYQYRRPDHPLIKFLHKHRLVEDWVLESAKSFHEAPQPRNMEFTRPSRRTQEREKTRRSRQRSRDSRHRHRDDLETQTVARSGGREHTQHYRR